MEIKSIILICLCCLVLLGLPDQLLKAKALKNCPEKRLSSKMSQTVKKCSGELTLVVTKEDVCRCQPVIIEGEVCKTPGGCLIGVLLKGDYFLTLFDDKDDKKKCKEGSVCYLKEKEPQKSYQTRAQQIEGLELKVALLIPRGWPCPSKEICIDQTWTTQGDLFLLKPDEMSIVESSKHKNQEYKNYDLLLFLSKGNIGVRKKKRALSKGFLLLSCYGRKRSTSGLKTKYPKKFGS